MLNRQYCVWEKFEGAYTATDKQMASKILVNLTCLLLFCENCLAKTFSFIIKFTKISPFIFPNNKQKNNFKTSPGKKPKLSYVRNRLKNLLYGKHSNVTFNIPFIRIYQKTLLYHLIKPVKLTGKCFQYYRLAVTIRISAI